jgi:hypothetical protein
MNDNHDRVRTVRELKDVLRRVKRVAVWCNCYGDDDGEYIETTKAALLRSIGADVSHESGGKSDGYEFYAYVGGDTLYVDGYGC